MHPTKHNKVFLSFQFEMGKVQEVNQTDVSGNCIPSDSLKFCKKALKKRKISQSNQKRKVTIDDIPFVCKRIIGSFATSSPADSKHLLMVNKEFSSIAQPWIIKMSEAIENLPTLPDRIAEKLLGEKETPIHQFFHMTTMKKLYFDENGINDHVIEAVSCVLPYMKC